MNFLKAVIFDWAGTTVDFGSLCPVDAFREAFCRRDISVSKSDILKFMGMHKKDHLREILSIEQTKKQWVHNYGNEPTETDVDNLFRESETLLCSLVADYAKPTPGFLESLEFIRSKGIKIGSTSGYTKSMMEPLVKAAEDFGYIPDCWIGSDQVPAGRPAPWMIYRNMEKLNVYPSSAIVKIGDAVIDIKEGLNAGAWSIGVVTSSASIGLNYSQWKQLDEHKQEQLAAPVREIFYSAGAHFVIDSLEVLPQILFKIDKKLSQGINPATFQNS